MDTVYLLNTDTTHSEIKPSKYADAQSTRYYIERPNGKILAAQTAGVDSVDDARAVFGTQLQLVADQTNRSFGTGRIVGIANSILNIGRVPTTQHKFYVYK